MVPHWLLYYVLSNTKRGRRSASWTTPNRNTLTTHSVAFRVLYGTLFAIASSSASSEMGCPKRLLFSALESWKSSASSRSGVKSGSLPPRSLGCFDEHDCVRPQPEIMLKGAFRHRHNVLGPRPYMARLPHTDKHNALHTAPSKLASTVATGNKRGSCKVLHQQNSDWPLLGQRVSFPLCGLSRIATVPSGMMPQSPPSGNLGSADSGLGLGS